MGKRSNFERVPRDYYPTPKEAFLPLVPHLDLTVPVVEPCAGDGRLVRYIEDAGGKVIEAFDIEPQGLGVVYGDAKNAMVHSDCQVVTNPPWDRPVLHSIIENLSQQVPTWLLFDADWMHTKQSAPFLPMLRKIVSVGRVKWIEGSSSVGKDNCAWYLFDQRNRRPTEFVGRLV